MSITHLLSPADILWKTLEAHGFDAEDIFLKEGITYKMILRPGLRVPHAKAERIWKRVMGIIKDPCFGLHAAKIWHPSHFNALGFAWLASSSLREALGRASRYIHIVGADRELRVEDKPEGVTVTLSTSLEVPPLMDLEIAILMTACRINYGAGLNPLGVNFIHSSPPCKDDYYSYFKAPIEFNCETDSITFSRMAVDKQLPIGNPHLAEMNDHYIIRYLAEIDQNNLVNRVKGLITENLPSGKISDEDVADKLNINIRTFQRKLRAAQTNFRTILNEVRQDLAKIHIHDSATSLLEIAFILGYTEYSSFSRAYKKWNGISPGKDRILGNDELGMRP